MTIDFRFYLSLFLRRLHYFLILFSIGSAVGITFSVMLPPVYRAEAVLIVESQQIPSDLAETTVRTETVEQLQIIQQRILTRESLLDMANRLRVYAPTEDDPAPHRLAADEIVADMRRRINIRTTGGAVSRGTSQATIVRVSFTAATAPLTAAVTNEVVTLILQENVEIRTIVAGETLQFFSEEVSRLDREIQTLGARILSFQQANLNALPDSLNFRRSQQAAAQERLSEVERDVALIRDRRDRLISLYESTGNAGAVYTAQLTPAAIQLQRLKDELSSMLAILAPSNPRVKVLQAQIDALEKTVSDQTTANVGLAEDGTQLSNYEIQLADLDGQLAFLATIKEGIVATMEELRTSLEATPGNAIILDTLERDYAALRTQYDQAVRNRARAETGDTIEALSKGQRISVIEQAVTPRLPESPNRRKIAMMGIMAGLAMGAGFIVLLELLNSAVRRPVDLSNKLGITPFGTVPHIRTNWEIVRRRVIIMSAFVVALVAIPVGLWFIHTQFMPLDLLLTKVRGRLGL